MLGAENLDGILMNTQHNFSWLTGGRSNAIEISRENGAGFLLVTREGRRCIIANNIEIERLLTEEISESDFEPIEITWQSERDPASVLNAARAVLGGSGLGCDIGFPETRWVEPSIASCRFELTPEEIERFRLLGRDAGLAIERVVPRLIPGQTEHEVARIVRDELAVSEIFPVVTLIGGDERIKKFRHPVPTENIWRSTLMIVVCARRHGLIASLTRIVCAEAISDDLRRSTESCAVINAALYAATKVGKTASELFKAADEAYRAEGFTDEINKHHQGGAAGYRTRDWVAHPEGGEIVRPNQGFAWNPSITGTKTEETAILIDGELEIITASPGFPKISIQQSGREYISPGILSLSKRAAG